MAENEAGDGSGDSAKSAKSARDKISSAKLHCAELTYQNLQSELEMLKA